MIPPKSCASATFAGGELGQEAGGELPDGTAAFPQRRQLERDDIEPEIQVGTTACHFLLQRSVAGRDQAATHRLGLIGPDRLENPLLDRTELGLQRNWQAVDVIQQERAAPAPANLPTRSRSAPVNAPLTWPNISLSIRVAARAQLITRNGSSHGATDHG